MDEVQPGQPITAELWNSLGSKIAQQIFSQIRSGPGIRILRGPYGVSIQSDARGGVTGTATVEAFDALDAGKNGAETAALINIKKGTLADIEPTAADDTTDGPDGYWQFAQAASQTQYGYLQVDIASDGTLSDHAIMFDSSAPTTGAGDPDTGAPPTQAYLKLFKVVTDADCNATITQYTNRSKGLVIYVSDWACATISRAVAWHSV